ncbi:MAG: acetolactate decarboxylase [Bacteroidetes bacterium]|nr:acetolactate decarboxylase [Bacteroidota bacterium]MCW5895939.1 acetolactate decarboxylase [Bacteroidota bacterium]
MRNVMWKGELYGTIDLDTISNKKHLYGLGPVEYLSGELLVFDGTAYKSTVLTDSTMVVKETFAAKAPFFVYSNIDSWREHPLPDSVRTMQQLEAYLNLTNKHARKPFAFKLRGEVESATIHVVNLPKGAVVRSPDDAHQGRKNYRLINRQSDIVGFFSREHRAVFTHHDSFIHMHLLTSDKTMMGHVDEMVFKTGMKLFLPTDK